MRPIYLLAARCLLVLIVLLSISSIIMGEWRLLSVYGWMVTAIWVGLKNKLSRRFLDAGKSIERRRPVWAAISEVYLDNQLQADDHNRIADVLRESGYADVELDWIMFQEVYPILIGNLKSGLGVWDGFDVAELQSAIVERNNRWLKLPATVIPGRSMVQKDWQAIRNRLAA